jgi:hypothetical protein
MTPARIAASLLARTVVPSRCQHFVNLGKVPQGFGRAVLGPRTQTFVCLAWPRLRGASDQSSIATITSEALITA